MRVHELHLRAADPAAQLDFYSSLLDLPAEANSDGSVTVRVGRSNLVFSPASDGAEPAYHFAVNVPEHRFEAAQSWLADRVGLVADEAGDVAHYFDFMNAHAVYARDPAGNVVELVARHGLDDAGNTDTDVDGPFSGEECLGLSEVGLPVTDVEAALDTLESTVGVDAWPESDETFGIAGDDHGMFIVVPLGREWFPTDLAARAFPLDVRVSDVPGEGLDVPDHPYSVTVV